RRFLVFAPALKRRARRRGRWHRVMKHTQGAHPSIADQIHGRRIFFEPSTPSSSSERGRSPSQVADLFALGQLEAEPLCQRLAPSLAGLTYEEAVRRLQDCGLKLVARERKPTILQEAPRRWSLPRNAAPAK